MIKRLKISVYFHAGCLGVEGGKDQSIDGGVARSALRSERRVACRQIACHHGVDVVPLGELDLTRGGVAKVDIEQVADRPLIFHVPAGDCRASMKSA